MSSSTPHEPVSGDGDVSRETTPVSFAPPAPAAARELFGDSVDRAQAYADLLADAGVIRGLIGPREVPRLWERHVLNSAALASAIPETGGVVTVADVGSGAGLPGIPLALVRTDVRVTLIEPLLRRSTFLAEAVQQLDLGDRVEVVRARADALHGSRVFDVVTARAVAALPRLLDWTLPLLKPGGELLALKGDSAERELEEAIADWRGRPLERAEVVRVGDSQAGATIIRVVAGAAKSGATSRSPRSTPGSAPASPTRSARRRSPGAR